VTPSRGCHPNESLKFFDTGQMISWKAERVGVVVMTKKVVTFFRKRVTPSVITPGDTNLSNAARLVCEISAYMWSKTLMPADSLTQLIEWH